jgi:hypothetical protein
VSCTLSGGVTVARISQSSGDPAGCAFGAPLDFVGLIGQLDRPKSQLINNASIDCSFCSLATLS